MTNSLKSILALLGTLLIGVLIGVLSTGMFVKHQMGKHKNQTEEQRAYRMKRMFYRMTDATEEQKIEIGKILDTTHENMITLDKDYVEGRSNLMDRTVIEMEPILSPEQMTKLKEHINNFHKYGPPHLVRRKGKRK